MHQLYISQDYLEDDRNIGRYLTANCVNRSRVFHSKKIDATFDWLLYGRL